MAHPIAPVSHRLLVAAGTTAGTAAREAGLPGKGADAVVVVRDTDGALHDLSWIPQTDTEVTAVAADTPDGRMVIRHSCSPDPRSRRSCR